ncbi:hypothetical protein M9Y10_033203 [Tritrichomonas musculus]|uniref:Ubiquitin-like domain-containing protein n=1 Tax=Tritrichomonas musculus TaxID=1915356 RepID=A0ABR2GXH5_9EUKA
MQSIVNNEKDSINTDLQDTDAVTGIIQIYVYQPYIRIRYIRLNENSVVSILRTIYPEDSLYIYRGQVLDDNKTFIECQIQNNNKIILIPSSMKTSNESLYQKIIKITSDQERFESIIDKNMGDHNKNEIARLKDIKFFKNEQKRKFLMKFANSEKFQNQTPKMENDTNNPTKIDFKKNDLPSTQPLPIIWSDNS